MPDKCSDTVMKRLQMLTSNDDIHSNPHTKSHSHYLLTPAVEVQRSLSMN